MAAGGGREGEAQLFEAACDRQRVAIVFNPASGTQETERRRTALEALAHAAGLTCELGETERESGAVPLARKAVQDGMERLLVSGGDGTVTQAAGALAGTRVALAVLPGGTGNLLSVNLGLPSDAEAAMRLTLTGEARPLDVGRANGSVFLIMAGMGLDAYMVRDADRRMKERLGVLAYLLAILRNLGRGAIRYSITIDGRTIHRRTKTVLVANVGRITGGLELVPGADPEDGMLDVAILRARGLWELIALAGWTLVGHAPASRFPGGDPLLEIHRGRQIVIETDHPQPVQLDGDEVEPTARLEVHVEPGALQLVRAPITDAGPGLIPPPVAAISRGAGVAWALLAGAGTAAVVYLRARAARALGRRPGFLARHPFLIGLAAGIVPFLVRKRCTADPALNEPREKTSETDEAGR